MPSIVNINGVLRESETLVNINGVLRQSSNLVNINGILRNSSTNKKISEEDIISFKIVYFPNKNIIHPDFPNLRYNSQIPAKLLLTGDKNSIGKINFEEKGVEFEYDRIYPEIEGIMMYEAHLYAILDDETPIDVCSFNTLEEDQVFNTGIKIGNDLKIEIQATLVYEANGLYMSGWNSLFNKNQFINSGYNSNDTGKNFYYLNSYPILPILNRENTFQPIAQIGIARDIHNDGNNMVGSYGLLDHTIHWISVNDIRKPFVIEVYD